MGQHQTQLGLDLDTPTSALSQQPRPHPLANPCHAPE